MLLINEINHIMLTTLHNRPNSRSFSSNKVRDETIERLARDESFNRRKTVIGANFDQITRRTKAFSMIPN
jgi:hypothetical protein